MKQVLYKTSRKVSISLVFLILMSTLFFSLLNNKAELVAVPSSILFVGGSGPGNYTFIQHAIDNASDGDTVFVFQGTYYEHLVIDKSITLKGEHRDSTIIDGENYGDVPCINIIADDVVIQGFLIQWSDWDHHEPGIQINSDQVRIIDNNISIHDKGINVYSTAKNSIIEYNIIADNHEGIYIWPMAAGGHIIRHNEIRNNNYGFKIYDSIDLFIKNNTIIGNDWFGILMQNTKDSIISKNTFENNAQAITIDGHSFDNLFFHNNFISNKRQVFDKGSNRWNQEYPCGGNYWSDYTGNDTIGDGFGDTPYNVPGRSENKDYYPFMTIDTWNKDPLTVSFVVPKHGIINRELSFDMVIDGGRTPYQVQWDFGDGTILDKKNSIHTYKDPGSYMVIARVIDGYYNRVQDSFLITIYQEDSNPPSVSIVSPEPGFHVNNENIIHFSLPLSVMIGGFSVEIKAIDKETIIKEIQMLINNELIETISSDTLTFDWPCSMTGFHVLEVYATDLAGNSDKDSLYILNI